MPEAAPLGCGQLGPIARRTMPTVASRAGLLLSAALVVACAPLPQHVYVPQAVSGSITYSSCAYNAHVPAGIALDGPGIKAHVQLGEHEGRKYVEVRFEVPEGRTLALQAPGVAVRTVHPDATLVVDFPTASLVDTPIVNATSPVPAVRALQLSPTALLVGGRVQAGSRSSGRHFWFAASIGRTAAEEIIVTLPGFTVNGTPHTLPPVHFARKAMVVVALLNC